MPLNERQQQYLRAIYETYLELAYDRQHEWRRFGRPRDIYGWRWMEYGVFSGEPTPLYTRLSERNLIGKGALVTFKALESRGLITCVETRTRWRDGKKRTAEPFLKIQLTETGRSRLPRNMVYVDGNCKLANPLAIL